MHPEPHRRVLLPRRRRVQIAKLEPEHNAEHFHHLAEIWRIRQLFLRRFVEKLRTEGVVKGTEPIRIDSLEVGLAQREHIGHTAVGRVLDERQHAFVKALVDIAGINRRRAEAVMQTFAEVYKGAKTKTFENEVLWKAFETALREKKILSADEADHLKTAYWDWIKARMLFSRPLFEWA